MNNDLGNNIRNFHKMVALTKAGEKSKAEAVYASFVDSLPSIDWLSEEDKKECIATLDHEIEYYGKYTG